MGRFSFLKKKSFWKKVMYAALIYGGAFLIVIIGLRIYTHHGKSFPVPDFKGLPMDRVEQLAEYNNLRIEIVDSTFVSYLPKGSVIDQNPLPGINVKKNRTVFLTTNAYNQVKVEVPRVVGYSYRQGKTILESRGLVVGKLIYKPDFAKNNILEQRFQGKVVDEGTEIEKGEAIDLVLGNGLGRSTIPVPDLTELYYKSALRSIRNGYFNIGKVNFDESVLDYADSVNAKVYKQNPKYTESSRAVLGAKLDIWLSIDTAKFPKPDTTLISESPL